MEKQTQVILAGYEIKEKGSVDKWNNIMNLSLCVVSDDFSLDKYSKFLDAFQSFLEESGYSPFKIDPVSSLQQKQQRHKE